MTAKQKKVVKVKIPHHKNDPIPEVEIEPVHIEVPFVPLTTEPPVVRCVISIKETFWTNREYIVITPIVGAFPEALSAGMEVDVKFLPPAPEIL